MPTRVNAQHILVKTEEQANEIINDLNDGKSFEELAKSKSSCPSGKKGGNLGWFSHGQMVREFQNAAFKLKKGEVSQPVKTQFGWHVIKCKDSKG
jgi:peptidyl-prolyl cis-trans isomerase C